MSEARIKILNMLAEKKIAAAQADRLLEAIAGLEPVLDAITLGERFPNAQGAILRGANTKDAGLDGAMLDGADLSGADLRGADVYGANLTDANLQNANLKGADLKGADLKGADLQGADLSTVNLNKSTCQGAHLPDANLRGAELSGANLAGLSYPGLNLAGMDLSGLKTYQPGAEGVDGVSFLRLVQIPMGEHVAGGIGRYAKVGMAQWLTLSRGTFLLVVMAGAVVIRISGRLYLFKQGDALIMDADREREWVAVVDEAVVAWAEL